MEKTISFHSDGKLVKINIKDGNIEIIHGNINETLPVSKLVNIKIDRRKSKFKPDTFFVGYAIFSTAISIGIVKILFKSISTANIATAISVIVIISIILQVNTANKKQAIFIKTNEKTIEIPIDETSKVESIKNFFKAMKNS